MTALKGKTGPLPFVFLNVATTADGKLAPANRDFQPFSSRRDQELLLKLRTEADAVMAGARTVDLYPVSLGPGPEKYRKMRLKNGLSEYNLRVVVSGRASLDPNAKIFRQRFSPILLLTTDKAPKSNRRKLASAGAEVIICGGETIDFRWALSHLKKEWDVKRLLCEGGGEINDALLQAGVVDEIYQTFCPLILGGRDAPTLADGEGARSLKEATRLKVKSMKRHGDELFFVFQVKNKKQM